jgi:hypothetical protein
MDLILAAEAVAEGECPECLTRWRLEAEDEAELPLAA